MLQVVGNVNTVVLSVCSWSTAAWTLPVLSSTLLAWSSTNNTVRSHDVVHDVNCPGTCIVLSLGSDFSLASVFAGLQVHLSILLERSELRSPGHSGNVVVEDLGVVASGDVVLHNLHGTTLVNWVLTNAFSKR